MDRDRTSFLARFLFRAVLGIAMIYLVNQVLETREVPVSVGMNPVTFVTSGVLGVPGVALLYGITCYDML